MMNSQEIIKGFRSMRRMWDVEKSDFRDMTMVVKGEYWTLCIGDIGRVCLG
jgi:hypothetical protein